MTSQLEQEVAHFQRWRDQMVQGIESYKAWLDSHGYADIQQSLRIYDLIESLRNDRMTLAFLAEFSRGKTELINAMFFSDFKQRLLPSDVGRTTMCPTEILHDPSEAPYMRLLPIETRKRGESVTALKRETVEWIKIRLNTASAQEMAQAMQHLAETKSVSMDEARAMGLLDESSPLITTIVIKEGDRVDVPAWRHAIISYPHPLLKSGLVVLDTPGLNSLGAEPELTVSMIPNAHAVLFLLGMDTGVTQSDLEVWRKFVQPAATRRIAVLNKIDLAWDELKSDGEIAAGIERQLDATSHLLELPRSHVFAASAQKALLARIRGDDVLLAKSGIQKLELLLASEIIPAKQEIMRSAVKREIGTMVNASRSSVAGQLASTLSELKELRTSSVKNRGMAQAMVTRLENDRKHYEASVQTFRGMHETLSGQGAGLAKQLEEHAIEQILNKDREFIEEAWTTAGMWKNMQALFNHFTLVSTRVLKFAKQLEGLVETTYALFHEKHGFEKILPPPLNLEKHALRMTGLQESARQFCHDPVNVAKYKRFVVKRFYEELVTEARRIFEDTRVDSLYWIKTVLNPLNLQIKAHEQVLAKRIDNFRKVRDNVMSVEARIKQLEKQHESLMAQGRMLAQIQANLSESHATPIPVSQRKLAA